MRTWIRATHTPIAVSIASPVRMPMSEERSSQTHTHTHRCRAFSVILTVRFSTVECVVNMARRRNAAWIASRDCHMQERFFDAPTLHATQRILFVSCTCETETCSMRIVKYHVKSSAQYIHTLASVRMVWFFWWLRCRRRCWLADKRTNRNEIWCEWEGDSVRPNAGQWDETRASGRRTNLYHCADCVLKRNMIL